MKRASDIPVESNKKQALEKPARDELRNITLSPESLTLLANLGFVFSEVTKACWYNNKAVDLSKPSRCDGYLKALRTHKKGKPYADIPMFHQLLAKKGPKYVFSYVVYMERNKDSRPIENYVLDGDSYKKRRDELSQIVKHGLLDENPEEDQEDKVSNDNKEGDDSATSIKDLGIPQGPVLKPRASSQQFFLYPHPNGDKPVFDPSNSNNRPSSS